MLDEKQVKDLADGYSGKGDVFLKMSQMIPDPKVKAHMLGAAETYKICGAELKSLIATVQKPL